MRAHFLLPVLMLTLACGSSKLGRKEAEKDIRQDYPVSVAIRVPNSASAIKGSPEHAKLVALGEVLGPKGWFSLQRRTEGDREQFQFGLTASAPKEIRTMPKGFEIPAAEAEFASLQKMEPTRDGAKVLYKVRLAKPTAHFPLFQQLHPDVKLGDTKTRTATYRKSGREWIRLGTDESFKKAE